MMLISRIFRVLFFRLRSSALMKSFELARYLHPKDFHEFFLYLLSQRLTRIICHSSIMIRAIA